MGAEARCVDGNKLGPIHARCAAYDFLKCSVTPPTGPPPHDPLWASLHSIMEESQARTDSLVATEIPALLQTTTTTPPTTTPAPPPSTSFPTTLIPVFQTTVTTTTVDKRERKKKKKKKKERKMKKTTTVTTTTMI